MYLNPFVAGILATVLVELVVVFVAVGISIACDKKKKQGKG